MNKILINIINDDLVIMDNINTFKINHLNNIECISNFIDNSI